MARLPYTEPEGEITEKIKARRGGTLIPLDKMLLHAQPIAAGWNGLLGAVRTQSTLPAMLREIAIMRVAYLNRAGFEWNAHVKIARELGMTDDQEQGVRSGTQHSLSDEGYIVLQYSDAMTKSVNVDDALFAKVKALLPDQQVVELTATIAAYNMVSRFLVALDVGEQNSIQI